MVSSGAGSLGERALPRRVMAVINQVYGLGFPKLAWGDKGYLPFNLQPADAMDAPQPGEDAPTGETSNPKPQTPNGEDETPTSAMLRLLGNVQRPTSNVQPRTEQRKPDTAALWRRHMRARA